MTTIDAMVSPSARFPLAEPHLSADANSAATGELQPWGLRGMRPVIGGDEHDDPRVRYDHELQVMVDSTGEPARPKSRGTETGQYPEDVLRNWDPVAS
ncbi:putative ATP-grasp-modified RiPP [Saccharopolyspora sp. K220]|uniref:putative ATP-grasp-modified RiPP n=1 Tax=Saccharopolyspora soli TaxID=2926618 RepID=UPI001F5ABBD2|nr:putative ATP-grasp-modified RiPP [Saccharopolyspora soli]MCI2422895.1 putative ATP-grasp-modified RiPP [Saccharopolyspora soli]